MSAADTSAPEVRAKFPAMLPREIAIWQKWLSLHAGEYERFDYNVRVGQGTDPGPQFGEGLRRMAILNSQLRIDAVGYQGDVPTLFEVKERATSSVVGQILSYRHLWPFTFLDTPTPNLLLVTTALVPDLPVVLKGTGIPFEIVPLDLSGLPAFGLPR